MSQVNTCVQVVVPRPFYSTLHYLLPESGEIPAIGARVTVPLGNQTSVACVLAVENADIPATDFALKPIQAVLDATPLPDAHLLELLQWAARYYHHPVGEVIFSALPNALRKPKPLSKKGQKALHAHHALPPLRLAEGCQLTDEQANGVTTLQAWNDAATPRPVLLHGITGSGKTEIYLRLIAPRLAAGKQVLIIVPEIGLTPQLVARFAQFFPDTAQVCLHSGLSEGERLQAWLQARNGNAQIIIGTRSAVFTPAPQLSLIIVDEEHDASLKQQEGFRYHGRDLAIKRAQLLNIPIVLGSATPALESLHNVQTGRYHYYRLEQRPNNARPPQLQVQDTRPFELQAGLTPASLQAIRQTLARGEQAMVFLNRRGFAPSLYCPSCGWQAACPHCSVKMTWHARRNRLVCHHCGTEHLTPVQCPSCHKPQLTTQGQGTERLELLLQNHLSDYPVIRIDRDSISRKGELEEKLHTVRSNTPLVLVGTQMLAKGHDFPNLTLVVIVDIDQSLLSTDYRALERLGQLLVQVAGRAGRATKAGQVILQTSQPEHPLLLQLVGYGYTPFARHLLEERKRWDFPPFGYHALLRASSQRMEKAMQVLTHIRQHFSLHEPALCLFGPVAAPIEKRANRYRAQLLVGTKHRAVLHAALDNLLAEGVKLRGCSSVRWSIDVDPFDFS